MNKQFDEQQPVDAGVLEALKLVMEDDYKNLINAYVEDCQAKMDRLRDAVERADGVVVMAIAHSLRGTSCNMGALPLARLSHVLEHQGQRQQWDDAQQQVARIETEFVRVCKFFSEL